MSVSQVEVYKEVSSVSFSGQWKMAAEVLVVTLLALICKAHSQVNNCGSGTVTLPLSGIPGPLPGPLTTVFNTPLQNSLNGPCKDLNGPLGGSLSLPLQNLQVTSSPGYCGGLNVQVGPLNSLNIPSSGPCLDLSIPSGLSNLPLQNALNTFSPEISANILLPLSGGNKDLCLPLVPQSLPLSNTLNRLDLCTEISPLNGPVISSPLRSCTGVNLPLTGPFELPLQNPFTGPSLGACADLNVINLINKPFVEPCESLNIAVPGSVAINEPFAIQAKNLAIQNIKNAQCSAVNVPIPGQLPILEPLVNNLRCLNAPDRPICTGISQSCTSPTLPPVVGIPVPVVSTTVVDNSFSNSMGNALQLLIVSDLIKSTLNCGPSNCDPFIDTFGTSSPVYSNVEVIAPVSEVVSNVDVSQTTIVENSPNFSGQAGFADFSRSNYNPNVPPFGPFLPNPLAALVEVINNVKSGSSNLFGGLPDVNLANLLPFGPIGPNRFEQELINPGILPPLVPVPSKPYGFGVPDIVSPVNLPSIGPVLPNVCGPGIPDIITPINEYIKPGILPPLVPAPLNSPGCGPLDINQVNLPSVGTVIQNIFRPGLTDITGSVNILPIGPNACGPIAPDVIGPFPPKPLCGLGGPDIIGQVNIPSIEFNPPNIYGTCTPDIGPVNLPPFGPLPPNLCGPGVQNIGPISPVNLPPFGPISANIFGPGVPNNIGPLNIPQLGSIPPNLCEPCTPNVIGPVNFPIIGPTYPNVFGATVTDTVVSVNIPQTEPTCQNACGPSIPNICAPVNAPPIGPIFPNVFRPDVGPVNIPQFGPYPPNVCGPIIPNFIPYPGPVPGNAVNTIIPVYEPELSPLVPNLYDIEIPEFVNPINIAPFESIISNVEVIEQINLAPLPQNQYVSIPELPTSLPVSLRAPPEIPIALSPINSFVLEVPTLEIELPTSSRNLFGCSSLMPGYSPEYEIVLPSSIPAQIVCNLDCNSASLPVFNVLC